MQITISQQGGIVVLGLIGRMDSTATNYFENACHTQLDKGILKIVIDLDYVPYISSTGLRSIFMMQKLSQAKNFTLVFCCVHPMVNEIFKGSGFGTILTICSSLDVALATIKHCDRDVKKVNSFA